MRFVLIFIIGFICGKVNLDKICWKKLETKTEKTVNNITKTVKDIVVSPKNETE